MRRAKVGNNNGQLHIATPPRVAHEMASYAFQSHPGGARKPSGPKKRLKLEFLGGRGNNFNFDRFFY